MCQFQTLELLSFMQFQRWKHKASALCSDLSKTNLLLKRSSLSSVSR